VSTGDCGARAAALGRTARSHLLAADARALRFANGWLESAALARNALSGSLVPSCGRKAGNGLPSGSTPSN
jgi:hypothetical protein